MAWTLTKLSNSIMPTCPSMECRLTKHHFSNSCVSFKLHVPPDVPVLLVFWVACISHATLSALPARVMQHFLHCLQQSLNINWMPALMSEDFFAACMSHCNTFWVACKSHATLSALTAVVMQHQLDACINEQKLLCCLHESCNTRYQTCSAGFQHDRQYRVNLSGLKAISHCCIFVQLIHAQQRLESLPLHATSFAGGFRQLAACMVLPGNTANEEARECCALSTSNYLCAMLIIMF